MLGLSPERRLSRLRQLVMELADPAIAASNDRPIILSIDDIIEHLAIDIDIATTDGGSVSFTSVVLDFQPG